MSNSFPSMISNEPPPLELSSEEDDSEEFRTPGLKLDLSAEPSPLSTPHKSLNVQPSVSSQQEEYLQCMRESPEELSLTNGHDTDRDTSLNKPTKESPILTEEIQIKQGGDQSIVSPIASVNTDFNVSPSDSPQDSDEFTDCYQQQTDAFSSSQTTSPPLKEILTRPLESVESFAANINTLNLEKQDSESALSDEIVYCDDSKDLKSEFESENLKTIDSSVPVLLQSLCIDQEKEDAKISPKSSMQTSSYTDISVPSKELQIMQQEIIAETIHLPSSSPDTEAVGKLTTESVDAEFMDTEDGLDEFQDATTIVTLPTACSSYEENLKDCGASFSQDDFGDFEAFQSSSEKVSETKEGGDSIEVKTSYIGPVDVVDEEEDDDDFGDFSFTSAVPPSVQQTVNILNSSSNVTSHDHSSPQVISSDDKNDFADFQNFQKPAPSTSSSVITRRISYSSSITPRSSIDSSATMESKFENLVKTVIPKTPEISNSLETLEIPRCLKNIDKELKDSNDSHWTHIQDFEESKGLVFKWPNSHCQQKLYRSLNIDTTTIVYTERWGAIEVPRFAASMVEAALLQPEVCPSSMKPNESSDVESKSRISNTDDTQNSFGKKPLSKEAQQILQQIPDLSFMRTKTLVFPQASASKSSLK